MLLDAAGPTRYDDPVLIPIIMREFPSAQMSRWPPRDVEGAALWLTANVEQHGVDAVQFRVPSTSLGSPSVPMKIRVNGQESNIVFLPVAQ